jgi:hypothetical protein
MKRPGEHQPTQVEQDNRSRQLNPEHDAYWRSRGEEGRAGTLATRGAPEVSQEPKRP